MISGIQDDFIAFDYKACQRLWIYGFMEFDLVLIRDGGRSSFSMEIILVDMWLLCVVYFIYFFLLVHAIISIYVYDQSKSVYWTGSTKIFTISVVSSLFIEQCHSIVFLLNRDFTYKQDEISKQIHQIQWSTTCAQCTMYINTVLMIHKVINKNNVKHILNICDVIHDCCIHQCHIILLELYWYVCVEGSLLILLGYLLYKILHSWVLQDNDWDFRWE